MPRTILVKSCLTAAPGVPVVDQAREEGCRPLFVPVFLGKETFTCLVGQAEAERGTQTQEPPRQTQFSRVFFNKQLPQGLQAVAQAEEVAIQELQLRVIAAVITAPILVQVEPLARAPRDKVQTLRERAVAAARALLFCGVQQ